METARKVLEYWLGPEQDRDTPADALRKRWFRKSDETDKTIRREFAAHVERAGQGDYDDWQLDPRGNLAIVILLDQFTRNIHRGRGDMYRYDPKAAQCAKDALEHGHDRALRASERYFLFMPFMHSEALADQQRCCELMQRLATEAPHLDASSYAQQHKDIVERFGRFPHRNVLLGRSSTPEELDFLKQPGSSF